MQFNGEIKFHAKQFARPQLTRMLYETLKLCEIHPLFKTSRSSECCVKARAQGHSAPEAGSFAFSKLHF
jgi:hypothetical protein